jgi:two-component system chemotaxis sensor kinase CheA
MDSTDQYLQADLTLDLLDQLHELESRVLAFEAGQSYDADDALAGSAQVLRDAASSAESLELRNVEHLTRELACGVEQLPSSGGSLQPHRIGAVLTAIDTLVCLLENVDCSDEFDISGQLSVLRDCAAAGELTRSSASEIDRFEEAERVSGRQGVVRRFDVPAGSPAADQSGLPFRSSANREYAGTDLPTAPPDSVRQLYISYDEILAQLQSVTQGSSSRRGATGDSDALFAEVPRLASELAARHSKQCDVTLSGLTAGLSTEVAAFLRGFVSRFVEDAVLHRIEVPVDRKAVGKPDAGQISVRVDQPDGTLRVRVADDGQTIDVEDLKARAVACRFVSCEFAAEMTDQEVLQMALLSGIAGDQAKPGEHGCRGLCGVRAEIERLGGRIRLDSRCPFGTEVEITLPQSVVSRQVVPLVSSPE